MLREHSGPSHTSTVAGGCVGNLLALRDLATGRMVPERILEL